MRAGESDGLTTISKGKHDPEAVTPGLCMYKSLVRNAKRADGPAVGLHPSRRTKGRSECGAGYAKRFGSAVQDRDDVSVAL